MTEDEILSLLNQEIAQGRILKADGGRILVGDFLVFEPEIVRTSEGFFTVEQPSGRYFLQPVNSPTPNIVFYQKEVEDILLESTISSTISSVDLPATLGEAKMELTEYGPVPFIGDGYEAVYAYTTLECKTQNLIKIGMSSSASVRGVVNRIRQQFGTSNPSPPEILLVMRVPDGYQAEQAMHQHLASKRNTGPGTEWFKVSLEEVVGAYRSCVDTGTN